MKLRILTAFAAAALLCGCQTDNPNDYTRIGYGPSFDVAHAQCEMRKGSVNTGYIAIGSPAFVAGAGIGNAIDNAVAQDQFMKNCLILQGWKRIPSGQKATAVAAANPAYADASAYAPAVPGSWINSALLGWSSANNRCIAGDKEGNRPIVAACRIWS